MNKTSQSSGNNTRKKTKSKPGTAQSSAAPKAQNIHGALFSGKLGLFRQFFLYNYVFFSETFFSRYQKHS